MSIIFMKMAKKNYEIEPSLRTPEVQEVKKTFQNFLAFIIYSYGN